VFETLEGVLESVWASLRRGVADRCHGFHTPALATTGDDGGPDVRTVVLRGVVEAARVVRCHTDRRAPKIGQIGGCSRAAWLFYDRAGRVQVRAFGCVDVVTSGPVFEKAWSSSGLSSRRCYLAPREPSAVSEVATANLPTALRDRDPSAEESEVGKQHFAVLWCVVDRIDWLHLHRAGHRRAGFRWVEGEGGSGGSDGVSAGDVGCWDGFWLTP